MMNCNGIFAEKILSDGQVAIIVIVVVGAVVVIAGGFLVCLFFFCHTTSAFSFFNTKSAINAHVPIESLDSDLWT